MYFGCNAPIIDAAASGDRDVLDAIMHVRHREPPGAGIEDLFPLDVTSLGVKGTEAAGVVKGCTVIRPHGFAIWEKMQADLEDSKKGPEEKLKALEAEVAA